MGLPTVLIAVRGFEASHMATLSNVTIDHRPSTIDESYSGGEAQMATQSPFSNSGLDAPARAYCFKVRSCLPG